MRRWGRALAGALGVCLAGLAARGVWSAAPVLLRADPGGSPLSAVILLCAALLLNACQVAHPPQTSPSESLIVDGVDLMQVYDRRNPEVPLYNQAQLDALQIGGYASYQLVEFGDSAADMLANFCDTVVIGTIESKQLIENGVPCTLVGVSVEQVLKGDPETLIYVMGTGAPVSQQQAASLESTKEDYDALPYIPIGTRVLLILQRDPDDPFPSAEKAAYTEVGMYNGCYGVDDAGALYPVVHSAGHQRLTRQGGASVYGQMLGALGSVQAVQAALSDPAA